MYEIQNKTNFFFKENLTLSSGLRRDLAIVLLEKEEGSDTDPTFQLSIF